MERGSERAGNNTRRRAVKGEERTYGNQSGSAGVFVGGLVRFRGIVEEPGWVRGDGQKARSSALVLVRLKARLRSLETTTAALSPSYNSLAFVKHSPFDFNSSTSTLASTSRRARVRSITTRPPLPHPSPSPLPRQVINTSSHHSRPTSHHLSSLLPSHLHLAPGQEFVSRARPSASHLNRTVVSLQQPRPCTTQSRLSTTSVQPTRRECTTTSHLLATSRATASEQRGAQGAFSLSRARIDTNLVTRRDTRDTEGTSCYLQGESER